MRCLLSNILVSSVPHQTTQKKEYLHKTLCYIIDQLEFDQMSIRWKRNFKESFTCLPSWALNSCGPVPKQ